MQIMAKRTLSRHGGGGDVDSRDMAHSYLSLDLSRKCIRNGSPDIDSRGIVVTRVSVTTRGSRIFVFLL